MDKEILNIRVQQLKKKILNYPNKSIAIYGTGEHTKLLLDYLGELSDKILCLVDRDENILGDKKIFSSMKLKL